MWWWQRRRLFRKLDDIIERLHHVEQELQNLITKVEGLQDAQASVVATLDSLGQMMRDAADDPAKVRELADRVDSIRQNLADAVVRNTPADPAGGGGTTP